MRCFDNIEVRPILQGEIVFYSVWDTTVDLWLGQGGIEAVRVILFDDDCVFCDRLPNRTYGMCSGECGALVPR